MRADWMLAVAEAIAELGLAGADEGELLADFCCRLQDAGFSLSRALVGVDTLHPVLEGRIFRWQREAPVQLSGYPRGGTSADEANWLESPFHHLLQSGERLLRRRLAGPQAGRDFPILADLAGQGVTDYVAIFSRFSGTMLGQIDGVFSSWATERPGGFTDQEVTALDRLMPALALAVKSASTARIAETLVEVYLGRDAGRRVLSGVIDRGVAERITAVLWYSDLQGFTRITDTIPPEQVIPLLNDYADAIVSAVHAAGGQVLKLIGDGILAAFGDGTDAELCGRALAAAADAQDRVVALNERRRQAGDPWTRFYLGLHIGEVFYGNVGSLDRLDFTVIGPAVNEVSRIAALCRSADQDLLLSSGFAAAAGSARLVSVGRYALRGVRLPQELFTVDRGSAPAR